MPKIFDYYSDKSGRTLDISLSRENTVVCFTRKISNVEILSMRKEIVSYKIKIDNDDNIMQHFALNYINIHRAHRSF